MSLTLQPNGGGGDQVDHEQGKQFVWAVEGGAVNVDMHGEKPGAGEKLTRYWNAKQLTSDQGNSVAPFDGTHGWFWRYLGDKTVTGQNQGAVSTRNWRE